MTDPFQGKFLNFGICLLQRKMPLGRKHDIWLLQHGGGNIHFLKESWALQFKERWYPVAKPQMWGKFSGHSFWFWTGFVRSSSTSVPGQKLKAHSCKPHVSACTKPCRVGETLALPLKCPLKLVQPHNCFQLWQSFFWFKMFWLSRNVWTNMLQFTWCYKRILASSWTRQF